jgi:hypothetical protein
MLSANVAWGGKNPPIHYIPKQDPIRDALETKTKTTYFKLMLPVSCNGMRVAIWASSTLKNFLIHVHGMVLIIKHMSLDTQFQKAADTVEKLKIDLDIAKDAHSKAKKNHKKRNDYDPPCAAVVAVKTSLEKAWGMWEEAGVKAKVIRTQIF